MNVFEKILLRYGGYVLVCVRAILESGERYEDCNEINSVLDKYSIDKKINSEDWIAEFWKNGLKGETAYNNSISYIIDAMEMYEGKRL